MLRQLVECGKGIHLSDAEANHPLVIGQKSGLGPLSPAGKEVWHGHATPCVSCGQLILRTESKCSSCGQAHNDEMLAKMARLSGPWFVFDHAHPFPGVSVDRILRLIERGQLVRTSIVRGPTTFYQWRFATEAPLVAQHLGFCWKCQHRVSANAHSCLACKTSLNGRGEESAHVTDTTHAGEDAQDPPLTPELEELCEVAATVALAPPKPIAVRPRPVREDAISRGPLIFLAIAVIVLLVGVVIYSLAG